jgi:hypothetical protein
MTKRLTFFVLIMCLVSLSALSLRAKTEDAVPYPTGYRQWAHVSSGLVGPQAPGFAANGGIHHIYTNNKGLEGYRTGQFPDGSVLVADFLETKENNGITTEGARRRIDVMVKDSKRYATTGGWGFEQFRGDSQTDRLVTAEGAAKCFACHATQKETDAVFSKFRK